MEKFIVKGKYEVNDFLYFQNQYGQKIYGDRVVLYENCGIVIYKNIEKVVSYVECTNIELVKHDSRYAIFAKSLIPFTVSIVFKEPSSFFEKETFKTADLVIRMDNTDAAKLEAGLLRGNVTDIGSVIRTYGYTIVKILDIKDDFKIVTLIKDEETVQIPYLRLSSLGAIVKNANKIARL
jgi:hypothetical protein